MSLPEDGLPDDRVTCGECKHNEPGTSWCRKYCVNILPRLPPRCVGFDARMGAEDQRNGDERWPDLKKQIAECRALEAAAGRTK